MNESIKKYTYIKTLTFEEGGIESYDYKSELSGSVFFSERSCLIEALNHKRKNPFYENMTLHQLELETIRKQIYVEIVDN